MTKCVENHSWPKIFDVFALMKTAPHRPPVASEGCHEGKIFPILGYCELLHADLDPADPHLSELAEIHKAGMSAAALTRQLLAFSRKQIIEPIWFDLNVLVDGMQAMLGNSICFRCHALGVMAVGVVLSGCWTQLREPLCALRSPGASCRAAPHSNQRAPQNRIAL